MEHCIIGDVHLVREGFQATSRDLARVVAAQRGRTLVFAGDLLDLPADSPDPAATGAVAAILGAHEHLRAALAAHVASGAELVLVAGNHDDDLGTPAGRAAFADALGLEGADRGRVRSTPWFARLGAGGELHVEHGHHFDPDNALPHPLAPPSTAAASLGIALMRNFIAPMGIHALVHANDGTPMQCVARSVKLFGARTPEIIGRYIVASGAQIRRAGKRYPQDAGRVSGRAAVAPFAREWGVADAHVEALVSRGATPTLASAKATFLRLYWDRVLPTAVLSMAGTSALLSGPGRRVALGAAAVLLGSIVVGNNRYRGRVQRALVENGEHIARATGARTVVFGHIHQPVEHGAYMNTGSFGFPGRAPGRPYVIVDARGDARHAFDPVSAAA